MCTWMWMHERERLRTERECTMTVTDREIQEIRQQNFSKPAHTQIEHSGSRKVRLLRECHALTLARESMTVTHDQKTCAVL